MIGYYQLIGQTPVPCEDVLQWAAALEDGERRVVSTDVLGLCRVSTVFLGLDHSFGRSRRPVLFETMAFWHDEGPEEMRRCSTWLEAEAQHAAMCRHVARPGAVLRYVGRWLASGWREAIADARKRWRELRGIEPSEWERLNEQLREGLKGL